MIRRHASGKLGLGGCLAAAIVAIASLLFLPTSAVAETFSISGTVTDATTGLPIANVSIYICDAVGEQVGSPRQTNADGCYSTGGLLPGIYKVHTGWSQDYVDEWYGGVLLQTDPWGAGAAEVDVSTSGASAVDFTLDPGYNIRGTVTDAASGLPIANVNIYVFDTAGEQAGPPYSTDAVGRYNTSALLPGIYKVHTGWSQDYVDEWYDGVMLQTDPWGAGAAEVDVSAADASAVDFALDPAHNIRGTVTDAATGLPAANVYVYFCDTAGGQVGSPSQTNGDGTYATAGLLPGAYKVHTGMHPGYIHQWYNGHLTQYDPWGDGATIVDTASGSASGIHFALTPGHSISGTIVDASSGDPIPDVCVKLCDADGQWRSTGTVGQTDGEGHYSIGGLVPGAYWVCTSSSQGYIDQLFDGVPAQIDPEAAGATLVDVTSGDRSDIHFRLEVAPTISGRVTDSDNTPLEGVAVFVCSPEGPMPIRGAGTAADGTYTLDMTGLMPGSYHMRALSQRHLDEWYDNVPFYGNLEALGATLVSVDAGAPPVTGIDFALEEGLMLSGTVTDADGAPISGGVVIEAWTEDGTFADSTLSRQDGTWALGVPDGGYHIRTVITQGYQDEWYDNVTSQEDATTVVMGGQDRSDIHFALVKSWAWVPASTEDPKQVTVQAGGATITFDEVTSAGMITVTPITAPTEPPLPSYFDLLGLAWSVEPGASLAFVGSVTIAFPYDPEELGGVPEEDLTILHLENGTWADVTVRPVDTLNNLITASVTSLSPFVLMAPANRAPALVSLSAAPALLTLGATVTMTGTFTDADAGDTHTATWAWDGATSTPGIVDQANGTVTGTYTYTAPGVYEVGLTVTDAAGAQASGAYQYVVVYDTTAGFVTGGGWIKSPAGAYAADPALADNAVFAFASRYLKGASVPSGSTQFWVPAARFHFRSTANQWLVVNGQRAQLRGIGTVNGRAGYGFLVSAIDGRLLGWHHPDLFRIKIWRTATGAVVYDNNMGADDNAAPSTVLGGGSMVIRK